MPTILKDRKILLIIILILTTIAALIFNVWQRSTKFKPQTSFPSAKKAIIELPKSSVNPSSVKIDKLPCPTVPTFCSKGGGIIKDNKYIGFGAKVATNSAIFAAFDGEITTLSITLSQFQNEKNEVETIETIYLDNPDKTIRAIYQYKGQPSGLKTVKKGQKIASVGDSIAYYDNISLLFALIKGDFIRGERVKLTSQDFE